MGGFVRREWDRQALVNSLLLSSQHPIKRDYDTILVHPREVCRLAIVTAASAAIVMRLHPSGESSPSDADIKVTRDLIRAGQLLKLELLDHVIIGNVNRSSSRELGCFFA